MNNNDEESNFLIANVLPGKLNSLVKNLMKEMAINDPNEAVRRVNSGEWAITHDHRWIEKDGIITFSVRGDDIEPKEYEEYLCSCKIGVSHKALEVLRSEGFINREKLKGRNKYIVKVIRGNIIDGGPKLKNIFFKAERLNLLEPDPQITCLIRKKFSNGEIKAMGLNRIDVMHRPVLTDSYDKRFLGIPTSNHGYHFERNINSEVFDNGSDSLFNADSGYAFISKIE